MPKRKLDDQIMAFLEETPFRSGELEALTELADDQGWKAALGMYLRFHDEPIDIMRKHQLVGDDIEIAKKKILERLSVVWLGRDLQS